MLTSEHQKFLRGLSLYTEDAVLIGNAVASDAVEQEGGSKGISKEQLVAKLTRCWQGFTGYFFTLIDLIILIARAEPASLYEILG